MKKKIVYVIGAILAIGIIGSALGRNDDANKNTSPTKEVAVTKVPDDKKESKATESEKVAATKAPESAKKPEAKKVHKHRKGMYGVSDQKAPDDIIASPMHNDATGNFKCALVAENFDVTDIALDYCKKYMKDKEVHYIVNFNNNTTSCITNLGDRLDITITEYVSKEEHDAKAIGAGSLLGEFHVYVDNGDVEKIQ